jgi:hypothetical protein
MQCVRIFVYLNIELLLEPVILKDTLPPNTITTKTTTTYFGPLNEQ